ncbi:hypothetical protein EKH55_3068 [Sinorhizobium alkalisoli]|nr:hypothetical protein EKH55_3068 [Sinorhizobium alkalisoli]
MRQRESSAGQLLGRRLQTGVRHRDLFRLQFEEEGNEH